MAATRCGAHPQTTLLEEADEEGSPRLVCPECGAATELGSLREDVRPEPPAQ